MMLPCDGARDMFVGPPCLLLYLSIQFLICLHVEFFQGSSLFVLWYFFVSFDSLLSHRPEIKLPTVIIVLHLLQHKHIIASNQHVACCNGDIICKMTLKTWPYVSGPWKTIQMFSLNWMSWPLQYAMEWWMWFHLMHWSEVTVYGQEPLFSVLGCFGCGAKLFDTGAAIRAFCKVGLV